MPSECAGLSVGPWAFLFFFLVFEIVLQPDRRHPSLAFDNFHKCSWLSTYYQIFFLLPKTKNALGLNALSHHLRFFSPLCCSCLFPKGHILKQMPIIMKSSAAGRWNFESSAEIIDSLMWRRSIEITGPTLYYKCSACVFGAFFFHELWNRALGWWQKPIHATPRWQGNEQFMLKHTHTHAQLKKKCI